MKLETHDVDFKDNTGEVIKGMVLDFEIAGAQTIAVYDTLMMFITNNPENLLQVYDIRTLQPLAMLCQRGRASNEFSDKYIFKSDQTFIRNGDLFILLRGEGGTVLKEINVSASIREGHTVVEGVTNKIPIGCSTVVELNDDINSLFLYNDQDYNIDREIYNVPSFSMSVGDITKDIEVYGRLVDFENERYSTFWYSGSICKHPSKNIVVQCMNTMDYIHFFDMDNNQYFSIHQTGSSTFENVRIPNKVVDGVLYYDFNHFSESVATEDMFLVMYLGGDYRKKNINKGNGEATELLAFDWEGNYLGGIKLDIFVHDLAFDSKKNLLYGLRMRDEKIVTYDLSDFIQAIRK